MNTREKIVGMFWGAVLIVLGAAFLITGNTSIQIRDPWLGIAFAGALSLAFFASYFLSGVGKWGWLFPACIFAAITLVGLITRFFPGVDGGWLAAPILLAIAAPFLVAYFQDREKHRWALIPAYVLAAITVIAAVADRLRGELVGTFVLLLIGLPFLWVYLRNRARRWALIVFVVLAAISIIPALSAGLGDAVLPVILILGGALIIYLSYRKRNA